MKLYRVYRASKTDPIEIKEFEVLDETDDFWIIRTGEEGYQEGFQAVFKRSKQQHMHPTPTEALHAHMDCINKQKKYSAKCVREQNELLQETIRFLEKDAHKRKA